MAIGAHQMNNSEQRRKVLFYAKFANHALATNRIQATSVRIAIAILLIFSAFYVEGFSTLQNLSAILYMTTSVGIAACGLALVTISGNLFVLSISATTSFSTIIFISLLPYGITFAIIGTLLIGTILGAIQGYSVGVIKTNPIITTIAAASVITGIGSCISGNRTLTSDITTRWLGTGHLAPGIPNQIIILLLFFFATHFFLSRMRAGREIKLIGVNNKTATLSGLRTGRAIITSYIICSFAGSLTGILIASQNSQGNLSLGSGLDFSAIAAVLVGGIAITGGQGRVSDALFGALFLAIVSNVLLLQGFSLDIQLMVKGVVVLSSVLIGAVLARNQRKK